MISNTEQLQNSIPDELNKLLAYVQTVTNNIEITADTSIAESGIDSINFVMLLVECGKLYPQTAESIDELDLHEAMTFHEIHDTFKQLSAKNS